MEKKKYRTKKRISHPAGSVIKGTVSVYKDGFYRFPYIGGIGIELGQALLISDPSTLPSWFEEIEKEQK